MRFILFPLALTMLSLSASTKANTSPQGFPEGFPHGVTQEHVTFYEQGHRLLTLSLHSCQQKKDNDQHYKLCAITARKVWSYTPQHLNHCLWLSVTSRPAWMPDNEQYSTTDYYSCDVSFTSQKDAAKLIPLTERTF